MPLFKSKPKPETPAPKPENGGAGYGLAGRAARQLGGRGKSIDEQTDKMITGARKTRTRSA